ncbi:MAG: hypothetical protein KAS05_00260 [Candidatus Omnitrophica bacterium]|nr:hypothetical protein [Candidatus Omnitrophota bacterium]
MREDILNYFKILEKRELLGTSYLFVGEDEGTVVDVVKLISCNEELSFCGQCWDCKRIEDGNHPDLHVILPEGLSIKIDSIREGIRFFSLKSFRLKKKILIIKDAQTLTPAAANAFLKTLEEPPKNSFIAISTSKLEGLLPTIISRCRKIFLPFKEKEVDRSLEDSVFSFLKGQDLRFADRKKFSSFLWALIMVFRDGLISKSGWINNQLPQGGEREIILNSYEIEEIDSILKDILKIYEVAKSINMNLALNLIRLKL